MMIFFTVVMPVHDGRDEMGMRMKVTVMQTMRGPRVIRVITTIKTRLARVINTSNPSPSTYPLSTLNTHSTGLMPVVCFLER